jgi:hypothetical protein
VTLAGLKDFPLLSVDGVLFLGHLLRQNVSTELEEKKVPHRQRKLLLITLQDNTVIKDMKSNSSGRATSSSSG